MHSLLVREIAEAMQTQSARFTLFLGSIGALTSLSIDMSLPGVPSLEHDLGQVAGRGGLTLSLFLAGYALTPLVGGPLSDRFGRRPVLVTSLGLFAVSALACALAHSFAMLLVFRLLQGCASGVATTLPLAIVRDLLQGSAARQRNSEVTTVNNMMPIVAPIFGSWLMILGSWRVVFISQAAFATAIVAALLLDFRESLPGANRQRLHPSHVVRNYLRLMRNRTFAGYSLIYGLNFACVFSFLSASPLILMQRMHVTRSAYTFFFAMNATGTILGSFTSGMLYRRKHQLRNMITFGLSLMVVASFIAAAVQLVRFHSPIAILIPAFLTLFGFGLTAPGITLEALEPVPHLAGSASGAQRSILMIFGSAVSGFLATYCARNFVHAELVTTLTMVATSMASLILYLCLLREDSTRTSEHRAE
jgi:DHA1 family bicyclomycin/chloramphenicol resistance-like MFS transporter